MGLRGWPTARLDKLQVFDKRTEEAVVKKSKKSKQRKKQAKKLIKKAKKAARKEAKKEMRKEEKKEAKTEKKELDIEIRDAEGENTDLENTEGSGEELT
jgi:hypothetical protein